MPEQATEYRVMVELTDDIQWRTVTAWSEAEADAAVRDEFFGRADLQGVFVQ